MALSAATGVLTGCGGGGGGGIASPTPGGVPTLPGLSPIIPVQAPVAVTTQTGQGITGTFGSALGGPIGAGPADVTNAVNNAVTLDTFLVPTYAPASSVSGKGLKIVKIQTAREAGLSEADLEGIRQELSTGTQSFAGPGKNEYFSTPIVGPGDTLHAVTFTYKGTTYNTNVFVHKDGTAGYNSVLYTAPGISEVRTLPSTQDQINRLPNGGSTVQTIVTNRNPLDGHIHYEFTLSALAKFNPQSGAANLSNAAATVDKTGPFVSPSNVVNPPTITPASRSQLLRSSATFQFKYASHLVWEIKEFLRLLLHNKTVTGSAGGSS